MSVIKIILLMVLLQFEFAASAQTATGPIKAEQMNLDKITGTYGGDGVYYTFGKKTKCKLRFVAPRSLVYKGTWEIKNDTLICTFNHVNSIGQNEGHKTDRFIYYQNNLYLLKEENGHIAPVLVRRKM